MGTVGEQARHASPWKRTLAGIFLPSRPTEDSMKFTKPALGIEDQLAQLIHKGMEVSDPNAAIQRLRTIGYYRLSAYTYPFKVLPDRRRFSPGTTFERALRLYEFDRELRLLVNDAVERCEVAIRSTIVNVTARRLGPHWFTEPQHFYPGFRISDLRRKIEEAAGIRIDMASGKKKYPTTHSETFISHYYKKYGEPDLPPIWMTGEVISFGVLSRLYSSLADKHIQDEIASSFGIHSTVFRQWLQSLAYLRNLCAHHSRLWNRVFSVPPKILKKHKPLISAPDRFYAFAVVLNELLKAIQGKSAWGCRLRMLLTGYPEINPMAMGFSSDWASNSFWNINTAEEKS